MRPRPYKKGDWVRILSTKFVERVGYPLIWYDLLDEVQNDINCWKAWQQLSGCLIPVRFSQPKAEEDLLPALPMGFKVRDLEMPAYFAKACAMARVEQRGFGGNVRQLIYLPVVGRDELFSGNKVRECAGAVTQVYGRRVVKTGKRVAPSSGATYSPDGDDHWYESGGLEDMKTHVLLDTLYGEIEACNVELVKGAKMPYDYTTQREVRRAFWEAHPKLPRRRITNHSGNGKMYPTDTRCAFTDFIDQLSKSNQISQELAGRVTLD